MGPRLANTTLKFSITKNSWSYKIQQQQRNLTGVEIFFYEDNDGLELSLRYEIALVSG
jgi:hypothetical protein